MWTGALSTLPMSTPRRPDPVRFTPEQADDVIAAIGDALMEEALTVDELTEAIVERTGRLGSRANHGRLPGQVAALAPADRRCGASRESSASDRTVIATSPTPTRIAGCPASSPAEGDAALRTLLARYLYAYGPATPQHFAQWLNVRPRDAADLFDEAAADLEQVELDGAPGWVVAGDGEMPAEPHRGIRLLPYFDAFVVAGQPRRLLYPGAAAARALSPSGQAGNYPVLLVDGVVGGVWHQRRSGGRLAVTVEPLHDLTAAQRRQLDEEVELLGAVMEAEPALTISTVTVGPHA